MRNKTNLMIMTALMMGMVMIMTIAIRIPVPATQGYIHLGDCMIFMSVLILGWKRGAVAAGFGSALADLMGGYAIYAPVSLAVKFAMAASVGIFINAALKKDMSKAGMTVMTLTGMTIGGAVMISGYYLAESLMYGSFITPLASVPMNILQFAVGAVIASVLSHALISTPAGRVFSYDLVHHKK